MKKNSEKKVEKRVRAPRGFHFRIMESPQSPYSSAHTRVSLRESKNPDREIGHISLYKHKRNKREYWETHSDLNSEYWGKGLGATMYAKAIQWCLDRGERVQSSGSSSAMAERVWKGKKIRQFFSIRRLVNKWEQTTWYAYR